MKKAILFEPELLAEVEQDSPDLYDYYCHSPLSQFEFIDYGSAKNPMYIQKEMLNQLEPFKKDKDFNIHGIILALQTGYMCGSYDLVGRLSGDNTQSIHCAHVIRTVINIVLNYPCYTIESLLDPDNFDYRNGIPYSKFTYQEAQYMVAWETILSLHEEFNSLFVRINDNLKTEDPNNKAIWCFPDFN